MIKILIKVNGTLLVFTIHHSSFAINSVFRNTRVNFIRPRRNPTFQIT